MRISWYKYLIGPFLLLLVASAVPAASTFMVGGISYRITSNATVSVYHDYNQNYDTIRVLTIPSTVTNRGVTYTVTSIDPYSFSSMNNLKRVEIASTVTSIGNAAFFGTNIKEVILPASLTTIGDSLFYATNLQSIVIPPSVTSIGKESFNFCRSLITVEIPSSVTSIGKDAFSCCEELTSITIPSSVTSIKSSTFFRCTNLKRVILPTSLTSIGAFAFVECTSLDSLCIPASVTLIQEGAFFGCTDLKRMYMCRSSPVPFKPDMFVFEGVDTDNCTLFVPAGSKEYYATAEQWKNFSSIVEFTPPVIDRPEMNPSTVFYDSYTGTLQFNGSGKRAFVSVYDTKGVVWLNQTSMNSDAILVGALPKSIYVVKVSTEAGSFTTKVLVQ